MLQKLLAFVFSLALLSLSACAGSEKRHSCTWTPDLTKSHDATFCLAYGANSGKTGSSMPVLEDPNTKKIMLLNGMEVYIDKAKTAAIKKRAMSSKPTKRECKYIWVSAQVELQQDSGEFWSPQWGSEERMIAKRTFPFYKVLVHELKEAKCMKK